jgi:hypothetical protein
VEEKSEEEQGEAEAKEWEEDVCCLVCNSVIE